MQSLISERYYFLQHLMILDMIESFAPLRRDDTTDVAI